MLGTNGERYVPHYKAIDVASDNRLAPGQAVTTTPCLRQIVKHHAFRPSSSTAIVQRSGCNRMAGLMTKHL